MNIFNSHTFCYIFIASIFLFSSCNSDKSGEIASELKSNLNYKDKQVELVGYIIPSFFNISTNNTISAELKDSFDPSLPFSGKVLVDKVVLRLGKEANNIYYEDHANLSDVVIFDNAGKEFKCTENKVKLKATVHYLNEDTFDFVLQNVEITKD
jgi:hypothetical protein